MEISSIITRNINEIPNDLVIEFFLMKINKVSNDTFTIINNFISSNENNDILHFIKAYYYFDNKKLDVIIANKNNISNLLFNYNNLLTQIDSYETFLQEEKMILDVLLKLICKSKNELLIKYNKLEDIDMRLVILWNKTKIKYENCFKKNNIENYKKIIECLDDFILINKKYGRDLEELNEERKFYIDKINFMELYCFDEYY
jgi:hypothetical protein